MFFSERNSSNSHLFNKAIQIVNDFYNDEYGLEKASYIKQDACEQFDFSAQFNLFVEFKPGKEQYLVRLSRRLEEETAPLTAVVFTLEEAKIYIDQNKANLLCEKFATDEARREIAVDIECAVTRPAAAAYATMS
jgi:hypothetical protein